MASKKTPPKPKRKPSRLKGMSDSEKRNYAISKYNQGIRKKQYEKAKKDTFGFTVIKNKKGTVTEQKI